MCLTLIASIVTNKGLEILMMMHSHEQRLGNIIVTNKGLEILLMMHSHEQRLGNIIDDENNS